MWGVAGVVGAILLAWFGRIINRASKYKQTRKELKESKQKLADTIDSMEKQRERVRNHAKRMDEIMSNDIKPGDAARMLSQYPSENKATRSAISKSNRS